MTREVPAMRPFMAAFALIACFSLPLTQQGAGNTKRLSRKVPRVDVKLTGPASVRPSDSLEMQRFTALLINRSADALVLLVRNGYLLNANWTWSITDATGEPVGMDVINRGFCGTVPYDPNWRTLQDSDVFVLDPGESREFPIAGPSDDYNFPTAGIYHLTVSLTYVPPNATYYLDERGKRQNATGYEQWDVSQLSLKTLEALQNSLSLQARSNNWNLLLPSSRPARR